MYMVVRVNGWQGYLSRQAGVVASYRQLVANHQAAFGPLPTSYFGMVSELSSYLVPFSQANKGYTKYDRSYIERLRFEHQRPMYPHGLRFW
jgi:hypothetical protein